MMVDSVLAHSEVADRSLVRLLDARTLAIVGASPNPLRIGGIPVETMEVLQTTANVLLVNRKYEEICGQRCYPNLAAMPWLPDVIVLAVPASEVMATLREAHALGIRAAVIFAAGFAEGGDPIGASLQAELVDFQRSSAMLIAGPNCMGVANLHQRLFANFIQHGSQSAAPGPVAVVSQSGNLILALLRAAGPASRGYSYLISTGNEACIDFATYLEHLAASHNTDAIVGYVEQIRDGRKFLAVAHAMRAAGKPLFLLKAGNSERGAAASASHTAAMAGDASIYDVAFRQLGVMTAVEPLRLMDLVRLWQTGRRPIASRIGVFSLSGAGCILMADLFAAAGGELPVLRPATQDALRQWVPTFGMVANPIDLTGKIASDASYFGKVLDVLVRGDEVDILVLFVTGYLLQQFAPILVETAGRTRKLIVAIDTGVTDAHATLEAAGIPVFTDMSRGVAAVVKYAHWCEQSDRAWRPPSAGSDEARAAKKRPIDRAAAQGRVLNEHEGKTFLSGAGLPMVRELAATDAQEAVDAARVLGMPVAVKILSRDIVHKTEVGGVRLNLQDAEAVREAFYQVVDAAKTALPAAVIDGVLVQRQIKGGVAVILGVTRDALFGPVMTVGLGGVLTELYKDVSRRLLPVDADMATSMISEIKASPLLRGFRGSAPADIDALVAMMVGLSELYLAHIDDLDEVELNPVLVQDKGCVAVDCLVTLREFA